MKMHMSISYVYSYLRTSFMHGYKHVDITIIIIIIALQCTCTIKNIIAIYMIYDYVLGCIEGKTGRVQLPKYN